MKFISLKVELVYPQYGYDENFDPVDIEYGKYRKNIFNEAIIPLDNIMSIDEKRVIIKTVFGGMQIYEYKYETENFYEELKEKLRAENLLI